MNKHEFGIMPETPVIGKVYDRYKPSVYKCISIADDYLQGIMTELENIDFYWNTLTVNGKGLAYCGITLIPPVSMLPFISVIENIKVFSELELLLKCAYNKNKWIIHFGL